MKKVTFGVVQTIYFNVVNNERKGQWEEIARDRKRFHDRINKIDMKICYVLQENHRQIIYKNLCIKEK